MKMRPGRQCVGPSSYTGDHRFFSKGVVLHIYVLEVWTLGQPFGKTGNACHPDPILWHPNLEECSMGSKRFSPSWRRAIFESIPTTHDDPKIRLLPLGFDCLCRLEEGSCDGGTSGRSKAIVAQLQDLKAAIVQKEGDDRVDRSTSECIIAQIELNECGFVLERIADRGECQWYLRDQTASKDVRKVCHLDCGL
jgi:hypothetical protein